MKSPDHLFKDLFVDLHLSGIWADGKVISDATPLFEADIILSAYSKQKNEVDFDLKTFFESHFQYFSVPTEDFKSDTSISTLDHIKSLWPHLSRSSDDEIIGSSLIALPNPYVVPGGRFNEIYYWDSYFTMLGLEASGEIDLIEHMIDNFSWQIEKFGYIPNGNRTYFLGRSQPPFFSLMVTLLANNKGDNIYVKYAESLFAEYNFWMASDTLELSLKGFSKHVVSYQKYKLNRYYDKFDTARPEMYGDDILLTENCLREDEEVFGNLRSACESGWDFSSRWLDSNLDLATIKTLNILPVDLNCLLYNLEIVISKAFKIKGNFEISQRFICLAENRKSKINTLFWNDEKRFYCDFNFIEEKHSGVDSLAAVFPLFFKIADQEQAKAVAEKIEKLFLKPGGVVTTTIESGQQWDSPNGWAPLQFMTVRALENYGFIDLAQEIRSRWLDLNDRVFKNTGKMLEKYNVVDIDLLSGGGEYPVQDGFGWTNGVYLSLY